MVTFNSDKDVFVEYFSFIFFSSTTALTGTRTGQNVGGSEWPKWFLKYANYIRE